MDNENNSTEDTANRDSNEEFVAVENISRPNTEFETTQENEAESTQPKEKRKPFFGSMTPVGKLKFWLDIILMGCAVVGPQVEHNSHVTGSMPMTKELATGINQGTLFIYIWGTVKYEDIFGQQRETDFCLRSKPKTREFHICKDGNYAN